MGNEGNEMIPFYYEDRWAVDVYVVGYEGWMAFDEIVWELMVDLTSL